MSSDLEDRVTELEFAISALDGAEPVAQLTGGRTISLSQIVTELDHTKSDVAGLGRRSARSSATLRRSRPSSASDQP
ncbi:hypothetical protein ACFSHQ_18135 [Gemmobacter lanyuensis]